MSVVAHALRRMSWVHRLFLLVLASNMLLILLGLLVVPATLNSAEGIWALLGATGLQCLLAIFALVGPWAFDRK
jgi:hypothetical protein